MVYRRKHLELTQVEVAKTLGYKRQYHISQIENGKRTLDPVELENFAHLYGKTLNDFATWRDDQPTTEELQQRAKEVKPKPLSKKAKKRLENLRKYGKPMPADVADALARKHFENPTIKESGEKS